MIDHRVFVVQDVGPAKPGPFFRDDIAMIKVIKGPFAGAVGNGGGGVIAIYTLKGEDEEEDDPSRIP